MKLATKNCLNDKSFPHFLTGEQRIIGNESGQLQGDSNALKNDMQPKFVYLIPSVDLCESPPTDVEICLKTVLSIDLSSHGLKDV